MTALLLASLLAAPEIPRVSFQEAVQQAAARAPGALVAADEVRRSEALLGEARSGSLPLLSATGTLTRLDAERRAGTNVVAAKDQSNATVSFTLPVLAPSRWAQWSQGARAVEVARATEADARRTVVLAAARAYLAILAQRRLVEVSRSAVDLAQARVDFARARAAGGVGNQLDEARAQQILSSNRSILEAGLLALRRAQEALGIAAGSDGALDAGEEPAFPGAPEEPAIASAPTRRTDVAAAAGRLELARQVARQSWTDWMPNLSLLGQGFAQDPPTLTTPRTGWQAQLVLQLPLFEGGFRLAQRRERDAIAGEAGTALDATLRQVGSEVRVAREALARTEAALAAARQAADEARKVLSLSTEAYKAGATNSLDLTNAQQASRDAELAVVIAEDAVRNARLDLQAAAGLFP